MRDAALQDKMKLMSSIGNGTCTINPIADIHDNLPLCLIADDVVRATIAVAHELSHPDNLDLSVRQATNPNVMVPESLLVKMKSPFRQREEFETSTLMHIKEFQKAASYKAISMLDDHEWTTQLSKCATEEEDADLRQLLKGTPLTLEELQFQRKCDGEMCMLIPFGAVYKIHGFGTAEHFVAGKLLRMSETEWVYYLNDSMGIRKNKGDPVGIRRPWVRVTTEMATRQYNDPKMPNYSKLEIAFVVYMKKDTFNVMSRLQAQGDIENFGTAHILSHQQNGCPVEVVTLLLSQLDWRMFLNKSGIQCHVGPYLPPTVGETTAAHSRDSIRYYPLAWAQRVLRTIGDQWFDMDDALNDFFELMEEHVLVYDREGKVVKYSRSRTEGFDFVLDHLFFLVSGFNVGVINGERVEYRGLCGKYKNNWYAKFDMTSGLANVVFAQFVLVVVRLLEFVFDDLNDNSLESVLGNILELGRRRTDSILATMNIVGPEKNSVEIEQACLNVISTNLNQCPSFDWLATVFFSFLGFRFVIVNDGPGLENTFGDDPEVKLSLSDIPLLRRMSFFLNSVILRIRLGFSSSPKNTIAASLTPKKQTEASDRTLRTPVINARPAVDHIARLSNNGSAAGFWVTRWNNLSLAKMNGKEALASVIAHIISECKRSLKLAYYDVTAGTRETKRKKVYDTAVNKDEDTKGQYLEAFERDSPAFYELVNTAVDAMPVSDFVVVLSPAIQDGNFTWGLITANPPEVLIKRLPIEEVNRSTRKHCAVPLIEQLRIDDTGSMKGDYVDIGEFYPAAWKYLPNMPQVFMCGMTVADDRYTKGQLDMYKDFRMNAAMCQNDPKIVSSVSMMQLESPVIDNL